MPFSRSSHWQPPSPHWTPPQRLEGAGLEALAEGGEFDTDESDTDESEDGEAVGEISFLCDLLNGAAVAHQPVAGAAGGEPAATDDPLPGVAQRAGEGGSVAPLARETLTQQAAPDSLVAAATQQATLELLPEAVDASRSNDEITSLARAADWVQAPRHASPVPERSGISTHMRDPRWAEEFGARISLMVRGGESSASLQLSPVDLGPLDVSVSIRDNQASVHFGAAQAETRALIEASIPRLREMLAAQGFQLSDASVSQGFSRHPRGDVPPAARADNAPEADTNTVTRVTAAGLLDLYV
jgi:flagellar hook-length control protein FliK